MSDFPMLLASEMGVSRRTVTRWCEDRKVPGAFRTKGGHWRLREPRRIERCWRKYDHKIIEFVIRYTSKGGYWQPIPDLDLAWAERMVELAGRRLEGPTPVTLEEARRMIQRLEWAKMILDREMATEMEELTASKEFNDALEFSIVAKGICSDDQWPKCLKAVPRHERSRVVRQHFEDLEEREPEKFRYLIGERDPNTGNIRSTPILDMIHPRAYEAIRRPNGVLLVKAAKLRLNQREVTSASLARELKISVSTLYHRYGPKAVSQACKGAPVSNEVPAKVRYQING
jgi:hypothetical protein